MYIGFTAVIYEPFVGQSDLRSFSCSLRHFPLGVVGFLSLVDIFSELVGIRAANLDDRVVHQLLSHLVGLLLLHDLLLLSEQNGFAQLSSSTTPALHHGNLVGTVVVLDHQVALLNVQPATHSKSISQCAVQSFLHLVNSSVSTLPPPRW